MTGASSQWGALVESVMREDDGDHDPRQVTGSAIGGCKRASAWRLAGVEFTDDEPSNAAAFIGGAIHEKLARRIAARRGDVAIEERVAYAYRGTNWLGRLDLYDTLSVLRAIAGSGSLVDIKTCGDHSWARAVAGEYRYEHVMQANLYAAACEQAGWEVTELRWVFIHRATGKVTELAVPYHSRPARAALNARLDDILDAAADPANAEREGKGILPEGSGGFSECNGCPFRSACWKGAPAEPVMGPHRREELARLDRLGMRYLTARVTRDSAADDMAAAAAELRDAGVWGSYGRTEARLNARNALNVKATK